MVLRYSGRLDGVLRGVHVRNFQFLDVYFLMSRVFRMVLLGGLDSGCAPDARAVSVPGLRAARRAGTWP